METIQTQLQLQVPKHLAQTLFLMVVRLQRKRLRLRLRLIALPKQSTAQVRSLNMGNAHNRQLQKRAQ